MSKGWGYKEMIIIMSVLIITLFVAAYMIQKYYINMFNTVEYIIRWGRI